MATSVRLDSETERLLTRMARERRTTKSSILREAIRIFARPQVDEPDLSPYERAVDLIGCVRGGPTDLSQRTGERLRRLLNERSRSR
jgi:predicted DNA-binding protein